MKCLKKEDIWKWTEDYQNTAVIMLVMYKIYLLYDHTCWTQNIKRYFVYYKSYNNKHKEIFQLILPEYANIMVCAHILQQIYTCSIIGQRTNILHEHEYP